MQTTSLVRILLARPIIAASLTLLSVSAVTAQQTNNSPTITSVTSTNLFDTLTITWTAGTAPYVVQRKFTLSDTNWFNLETTTNLSAVVEVQSDTAFFRIANEAQRNDNLVILEEPQSQIAETNSKVTFSVVAIHDPPSTNGITYQWKKDGTAITGATNSSYTIPSAQFTDVAEYTVHVTGSDLESQGAQLAVYALTSSGGTLQTPIGYFSPTTVTCDNGTFNKGFAPTNGNCTTALFYGPNASGQTGIFANSSHLSNLEVDTFGSTVGIDTGLRLRGNWSGTPIVACNDNASPSGQPGETDNRQSKFDIPLSTDPSVNNSYRLTVMYKDTPSQGTITLNWLYH